MSSCSSNSQTPSMNPSRAIFGCCTRQRLANLPFCRRRPSRSAAVTWLWTLGLDRIIAFGDRYYLLRTCIWLHSIVISHEAQFYSYYGSYRSCFDAGRGTASCLMRFINHVLQTFIWWNNLPFASLVEFRLSVYLTCRSFQTPFLFFPAQDEAPIASFASPFTC